MEQLMQMIQDVIGAPEYLVNLCWFIPEYIRSALISSIYFIPILYILYYLIELLERFFLKNIRIFSKLTKRFGPLFGAGISLVPECGYSVIASTFYSRKIISKGTLLAFLIACSDDAVPLLFMDFSKAGAVIPLLIIKFVVAFGVGLLIEILERIFRLKAVLTESTNAVNTDLCQPGCCHHMIHTIENPAYWWKHPIVHTFNMFMFTFIILSFLGYFIYCFNGVDSAAQTLMIYSYIPIFVVALIGLIPNCVSSVFIALCFVMGLISFPSLVAGLITATGLGLGRLSIDNKDKKFDNNLIAGILYIVAVGVGLFLYFNEISF